MKKTKKRRKRRVKTWVKVFLTTAIILGGMYAAGAVYFHGHYFYGTTVNGSSVAFQTAEAAKKQASSATEDYTLTISERGGGSEEIEGSQIGLEPVFGSWFEDLMKKQNELLWPLSFLTTDDETLSQVVSYDEDKLDAAISSLNCMDSSKWVTSENASLGAWKDGSGYELKKAVYGTQMDTGAFTADVKQAVSTLETTLDLTKAGVYVDPVYDENSQQAQQMKQTADTYGSSDITYTFGNSVEEIDRKQIEEWMDIDSDLNVTLDQDAIAQYVAQLADTYNTAGQAKTLATSYGQNVTITGGTYGWKINQASTVSQILEKIQNGEAYSGDPVYTQTANSHDGNDYGNTYVEINLAAQHLYFYKNGSLVTDCDIVSGNESEGNGTPTGAYFVNYLDKDATLKGEDYESEVSYWMPFNGNIGMHDADWRSAFGGTIYKTNGSHGCINMPPASAAVVFHNISAGTPVLVYTLAGTESSSSEDTSTDASTSTDSDSTTSTDTSTDNTAGEE